MGHPIFFYTFAGIACAGALGVALARHPVYAVLNLVGALFALSGLFVLLNAHFVAMIQVLIYAGAILVLFLFVVMLLDLSPEALRVRTRVLKFFGAIVGLFFLWQMLTSRALSPENFPQAATHLSGLPAKGLAQAGTTAAIGKELFTTYALPFEVASLLLLVGVIGAVVLAKKKL